MPKHFSLDEISSMNRDFRRNFINTVSGIKSANLIGTLSYRKVPNVAIFNSVVHISASPPLLGFIMRPLTVPRQTYHNIKARKHFTINSVTADFYQKAHQTSAKYDEHTSEFEAVGLTPFYSELLEAPYVQESPAKIGLELEEIHEIRANGCLLIVGRIQEIFVEDELIHEQGYVLHEKQNVVTVSGLDRYYQPELLSQQSYARPKKSQE
jgi:flavin reductase (DIM6/NTAB) family NADH-FMN oxidoreductase RutF